MANEYLLIYSFIGDTGIGGGDCSDFLENFLTILVLHFKTHATADFTSDPPVILSLSRRFHGFTNTLDTPLGIGKSTVFFSKARGWKTTSANLAVSVRKIS
jgi:hypothetical protein